MRLASPFGALVSRTASLMVRRCAFPEQSGAPTRAHTPVRSQPARRSPAIVCESMPVTWVGSELGYSSTIGGVGTVLHVIPDAHEAGSHGARPEHSDAADTYSVRELGGHRSSRVAGGSPIDAQTASDVRPAPAWRRPTRITTRSLSQTGRKGGALCAPLTAAMRRIYRLATCAMFHVKQGLSFQRPGLRRHARGPGPDASPSGQDFLGSEGAQHWTPAGSWGLETHLSMSER
jgi:hypothetical protein